MMLPGSIIVFPGLFRGLFDRQRRRPRFIDIVCSLFPEGQRRTQDGSRTIPSGADRAWRRFRRSGDRFARQDHAQLHEAGAFSVSSRIGKGSSLEDDHVPDLDHRRHRGQNPGLAGASRRDSRPVPFDRLRVEGYRPVPRRHRLCHEGKSPGARSGHDGSGSNRSRTMNVIESRSPCFTYLTTDRSGSLHPTGDG